MYLKVITTLAVVGCVAILVAVRRFERAGEDGRPRARPALADARLDATIAHLRLDRATLEQAVDALRQGGVNIVVSSYVLDHPDRGPVSLDVRGVRLSAALRLILDQATAKDSDIDFAVREGVIVIDGGRDVGDRVVVRLYDVQDLLPPPSPPGPGPEEDEELPAGVNRGEAIEKLCEIIKEHVDSDSWRDNGGGVGSVYSFNDFLLVRQTPENQREIEALLASLRRKPEKQ